MTKFWIQILLQFYWRAKKVTKIKLAMIMVKSFDKSQLLFTLHIFGYYFLFACLRFKFAEYKGSLTW